MNHPQPAGPPSGGGIPGPETARSLQELGALLRRLRESRRLPLEEIARTTKVRLPYLEGLETSDLRRLPGGLYPKGYLRSYLAALGQDPGPWLRRFDELSRPKSLMGWAGSMGAFLSAGGGRLRAVLEGPPRWRERRRADPD